MSLAETRLRAFFTQLEREQGYGWKSEVARRTGLHQSHVGRIAAGERGAGPAKIEAVQNAYGISPAYFSDPSLGDEPDYRAFVTQTTVELDAAQGTPEVEAYLASLAERGVHVEAEHATKLRGMRRHGWVFEPEEIAGYHAGMTAADARKEVEALAGVTKPPRKKPSPTPRKR